MDLTLDVMHCARNRFAAVNLLVVVLVYQVAIGGASASAVARYQPPAPPAISADAVFVADVTSGTELFALNPDAPLPPASLTKIVAALVILERANLEDSVEILADDLVSPEESQVGLVAGDRLSVRDLLFGALIPSGNDATRALARHVGSASLEDPVTPDQAIVEFVSLMNEKAHAVGATASHFENPTGIDAEDHVMSARDVATVTAAALDDVLFSEIVSTSSAILSSELRPDGYSVQTTNLLLLEGAVNGVKTGTTPAAGGCLVTSYPIGPNRIVAVVLGSELTETTDGLQDNTARFSDTRALLDAVTADYSWLDPADPGIVAGLHEELDVWQVDLANDVLLPVPAGDTALIRFRLVLHPPAAPRERTGEILFFVGEDLLSQRETIQAG